MSVNYTLITGASGGLGREYSHQLAKENNLLLVARNMSKLNYFGDSLRRLSPNDVSTFKCDVSKDEDIRLLFEYIDNNDIKLDKIIHIAGIEAEGWFKDVSHQRTTSVASINAVGATNIIHRAIEHKADHLNILLMSSLAGFFPMPMKAVYSASKRYLIHLARTLNYELKDDNIHITVVCPAGMPTRPDIIEKIKSQGLMGRLTTVNFNIVIRNSLKKLEKNRFIYIPGGVNQVMTFFSSLLPDWYVVKMLGKRWKKTSNNMKK